MTYADTSESTSAASLPTTNTGRLLSTPKAGRAILLQNLAAQLLAAHAKAPRKPKDSCNATRVRQVHDVRRF